MRNWSGWPGYLVKLLSIAIVAASAWLLATPDRAEGRANPVRARTVTLPSILRVASSKDVQQLLRKVQELELSGDIEQAEAVAREAVAAAPLSNRRNRDDIVAFSQAILGDILIKRGSFLEAEGLLRTSLATLEERHGLDDESTVVPRNALAALFLRQGRRAEAAGAYDLSLRAIEKATGPNSLYTAEALNNATSASTGMVPMEDTEAGFRRVLKISRRHGDNALDLVGAAANNLAQALRQMGRNDEAAAAYEEAYAANAKFFGEDHSSPMLNLMNAGVLYRDTGKPDVAAGMLSKVLEFNQRRLGSDHPQTALSQNNMGWVELARNQPLAALPYFRSAVDGYEKFRARQSRGIRGRALGIDEREVGRSILGLLTAISLAPTQGEAESSARLDEGFKALQRLMASAAATALASAGARFDAGEDELGALLRRGQDIGLQWQHLDAALINALAQPAQARQREWEAAAASQMKVLGQQLDEIDAIIQQRFPDYANLTNPHPLSVADTQKLLKDDEALVQIASFGRGNGDGTFVWLITAKEVQASYSLTALDALALEVFTLRCGLDIGAGSTAQLAADCDDRTGGKDENGLPRFNAKSAFNLYQSFFRTFGPTIEGKSLIVVAPDPIAALPFQVLVTKPPAVEYPESAAEFREISWLGRDHAISVLPSVNALASLRRIGIRQSSPESYIAFGDPVLDGNLGCPLAGPPPDCPGTSHVSSLPQTAIARSASSDTIFKSGIVDVEAVRALCPLPETADELRCVAASLGASPTSVHLAEGATKSAVLNADLAQYRIIHFATHGLVAGDLQSPDGSLAEPALVLTPPATVSSTDDGLLKASDVVELKLNADWVVLSACNTASGQKYGGEALSGLASAFLYSGAKALLASHWPVRSDAAVRLTTFAFSELAKRPEIGRAEAMRLSMVELLDHGGEYDAHPMVWAPFSVIGEGGSSVAN